MYYKEALCSPLPPVSMVRLQVSVCIIKRLSARCCCKHQWRDNDFRYMLYRSSMLATDVYSDGDTAIFVMYYKALYSPLLHASTARPRFSVYMVKKLYICRCCMHQWQFSTYIITNCPARSCCMHEGWDRDYLMSYKKALCSPLLHVSMVRLWFSVYIIKKFMARHCWMHEWRDNDDNDFRYML